MSGHIDAQLLIPFVMMITRPRRTRWLASMPCRKVHRAQLVADIRNLPRTYRGRRLPRSAASCLSRRHALHRRPVDR